MTEIRVFCDRCGSVVLDGRLLLKVEAGELRRQRREVDLCADCSSAFAGFLDGGARRGEGSRR